VHVFPGLGRCSALQCCCTSVLESAAGPTQLYRLHSDDQGCNTLTPVHSLTTASLASAGTLLNRSGQSIACAAPAATATNSNTAHSAVRMLLIGAK
jgi:hypothetical protein